MGAKIRFLLRQRHDSFVSQFDKLSILEKFELTQPIGNAANLLQNDPLNHSAMLPRFCKAADLGLWQNHQHSTSLSVLMHNRGL